MKRWILKNTSITEEQYDAIMKYGEYDVYDESSHLSKAKKHEMLNLLDFSMHEPDKQNLKIHHVKKEGTRYIYHGIYFDLLSSIIRDPMLFSPERCSHSCMSAITLSNLLHVTVVTAICIDYYSHKSLRTFLKASANGEDVILDYSSNLVMDKIEYYDMFEVEEVSVVNSDTLEEVVENVIRNESIIHHEIDDKEILCFPKEVNEAVLRLEHARAVG